MAKKINITAQLNAATTDGILASANQIYDENKGKFQEQVNEEFEGRLVVADGEDLVTDGNVLRLKDRPNTDGMGYVILRKEKTFQEQVTKPNTIYEIRYDFDLGRKELPVVLDTPFVLPGTGGAYYRTGDYINVEAGMTVDLPSGGVLFDSTLSAIIPAPYTPSSKRSLYVGKLQSEAALGQSCVYSLEKEVVIPENCVLKFEGGSLSNGAIVGDDTNIKGDNCNIFYNIEILGNWNVPVLYSSCFKDISSLNVIKQLIALTSNNIYNKVVIDNKCEISVEWNDFLDTAPGVILKSNTELIINNDIVLKNTNLPSYSIIYISNVSNIKIEGTGSVIGDRNEHVGNQGEWGHGINIINSTNVSVNNISISNCWGDGIYIGNNSCLVSINKTNIFNNRRQGISITSANKTVIDNCIIDNINGTEPESGIDIEPNKDEIVTDVTISNTTITNCKSAAVHVVGTRGKVQYANITNCTFKGIPYDTSMASASTTKYGIFINKVDNVLINNLHYLYFSLGISSLNVNNLTVNSIYSKDVKYPFNLTDTNKVIIDNSYIHGIRSAFYALRCNNIMLKNSFLSNNSITDGTWHEATIELDDSNINIIDCNLINTNEEGYSLRGKKTTNTEYPIIKIDNSTLIAKKIFANNITNNLTILNSVIDGEIKLNSAPYTIFKNNNFKKYVYINDAEYSILDNNIAENALTCRGNYSIYSNNKVKHYGSPECAVGGSFCKIINNIIEYKGENTSHSNLVVYNTNSYFAENVINTNNIASTGFNQVNGALNNCFDSNEFLGTTSSWPVSNFTANNTIGVTHKYKNYGTSENRPRLSTRNIQEIGFTYRDITINKIIQWTENGIWVDNNNDNADWKSVGMFHQKPENPSINFQFFCTDKKAAENGANGIMIYHKGDNVWVDALGREVTKDKTTVGLTHEVKCNINGQEYDFLSTTPGLTELSIYAPTELGNDNYIVAQQNDKAAFVDPADIGLK